MGIPTMGSQGGGVGASNEKQPPFESLARQNSFYTLTLDEVENQLGDLGKPLSSMNLDELLKSVWTAEANNQSMGMDIESTTALASQTALQRQASLSLTSALSKKTVDEVWKDIQHNNNNDEREYRERERERNPTLGEMTLEDFLVKAGVVAEASVDKKNSNPVVVVDPSAGPPQYPQQTQWLQYQNMMGVYVPAQQMPIDVSYGESQAMALSSPGMGALSDTQIVGRKRVAHEDIIERTVERRQKRMIKNRESAARSRARKQAYTTELEHKVSRLEEENERLRKRKELEKMLPTAPPPEPKHRLRRTSSAPL